VEQYELDPRFRAQNVERITKHFHPIHVFIRRVGSRGGGVIVSEGVRYKTATITRVTNALLVSIDGVVRFTYIQSPPRARFEWGRKFSIAYERDPYFPASTGFDDPYDDQKYPPIHRSVLRGANVDYLLEITFDGVIPLEKAKLWVAPMYYWRIKFS